MFFSIIVEALDLGDIFQFFFDGVGIGIYCREVLAMTPLAILALKTFLVLVFHANLALIDRKLLVLTTRYVSKMGVSGFSSFGVFLLLFGRPVPLRTSQINLPDS